MNARSRHLNLIRGAGAGAVAVALVGAALHFSSGSKDDASTVGLTSGTTTLAGAQTVNCPDVAGKLGNVPAGAQAGVTAELANLAKEIDDDNARLAKLAVKPEGGANFVQNAIIGPLKDKRIAVIDRIILDITRVGGT